MDKTKVIACATVIEEMLPLMPANMAYEVLDFGLHLSPNSLKQTLQDVIDASSQTFDTIVLGYGLCSMAVVGLQAKNCRLIIPRVDDCISLFLGSREAYTAQVKKVPGTYYLTKGWIEVGDSPFQEYERLVRQYGKQRADSITNIILKHYTRLVYINTGQKDQQRYRSYARKTAKKFNLVYEEIPGANTLIKKLLYGPWDGDILVAQQGHTIQYMDFKTADLSICNSQLSDPLGEIKGTNGL